MEALASCLGTLVVVILIVATMRGCISSCSTDAFKMSKGTDEVLKVETEIKKWAEQRKATLLDERARAMADAREARRRAERDEEDRRYDEARTAEREALARARRESERMERWIKERERASDRMEDELRTFALKESPRIWQTVQFLRAEIADQDGRIEELKDSCRERGIFDYSDDPKFVETCRKRNRLVRSLRRVEDHLVDALIAQRKWHAEPFKHEFEATMKRALEDGITESDLIRSQYEEAKNEM